ncbi:MAG: alkaline phosphatase [Verrucomicrobiota bacterium]
MSWRIPVVAAMVLGVFSALAFLYYKNYVEKRNYGIILFVVNGLDSDLLHRARLDTQLARNRATLRRTQPGLLQSSARRAELEDGIFYLESFPSVGMLSVQGPGTEVADEGALATALACGRRVPNGMVGCDGMGQPLKSLLQVAAEKGRATGLITTAPLTAATPLAFYGHHQHQADPHDAAAQLARTGLNIVMGGGMDDFTPIGVTNEAGRTDRRNVAREMQQAGYTLVTSTEELEAVPAWRTGKLLGIFSSGQMLYEGPGDRLPEQPSLAEMVRRAIECFNFTLNGYVLVVEHDLVKRAAENNFTELAIQEAQAFDEALRVAREYAGRDALIVVTNSFSLGAQPQTLAPLQPRELVGATLPVTPDLQEKANQPAPKRTRGKKPATEEPAPSTLPPTELLEVPLWLTGPGAVPVTEAQQAWQQARMASGTYLEASTAPRHPGLAARFSRQAVPTTEPAWIAAGGLFSEDFSGFMPNTRVYDLLVRRF